MSVLNLPPKFVAREKEFELLRQRLENAKHGTGSTVFIAGESGVGKTRLVEELIAVAEQHGFQVFRCQCFLESMAPYAPVSAVLREAGLEHLLTETKPPKLEALYGINKGGMITAKYERKESIDPDIFMGMVTAVESFVKESLALMQRGEVSEQVGLMGYGSFFITNVPGRLLNLVAVTTGRENEYLISDLREMLDAIENEFREAIASYEGLRIPGIEKKLKALLLSGKYEGIDYAEEDAKIRQTNLFENVTRGIQRKAEQKPVLIFIDDMQWSDPSSLAMLHYIARNTKRNRVLIAGTYRTEEIVGRPDGKMHHLVEAMEKMGKEELIEKVELRRLDEKGCHALICSMLGSEIETEFSDRIYSETEGNTFFVVEILKTLYEERQLYFEEGKWQYNLETLHIPGRIYELILRRLERLAKEERELLDAASVLGEEFTSDLLARVTDITRVQVVKLLVTVERSHKLIRALKEKYRFEHGKIREVLYTELPDELKTIYHELAGKALEDEYRSGRTDVVCDIVYHYSRAGFKEKVTEYGLSAGKLARNRCANDESIGFYRAVLDAMGDAEDYIELKVQVLEELAEVLEVAGRYDDALEMLKKMIAMTVTEKPLEAAGAYRRRCEIRIKKGEYDEALEEVMQSEKLLITQQHAELELARTFSTKGNVLEQKGEYEKALECQRTALAVFEKVKMEKDIANASNRMGVVYHHCGDYEKALEFYTRSLNIREKIGDVRGIASSYNNIGIIYHDRGKYEEALEFYIKSLNIREKIGDVRGIAMSYNNLGVIYYDRGEYEKALDICSKSLMLKEKIGDVQGIATAYSNIGTIYHVWGKYEKALEFFIKGLNLYEKIGDVWGIASSYSGIGLIHHDMGEYEKALRCYTKSLDSYEKIGQMSGIADACNSIGLVYHDRGEYRKALKFYTKSIQICRQLGKKRMLCFNLIEITDCYLELNDLRACREKLAEVEKIIKEISLKEVEARFLYTLSQFLAAEGNNPRAEAELRKAVKIYEDMKRLGIDYHKAVYALGKLRNDKLLLEKALGFFERIGNRVWTSRVQAALQCLE